MWKIVSVDEIGSRLHNNLCVGKIESRPHDNLCVHKIGSRPRGNVCVDQFGFFDGSSGVKSIYDRFSNWKCAIYASWCSSTNDRFYWGEWWYKNSFGESQHIAPNSAGPYPVWSIFKKEMRNLCIIMFIDQWSIWLRKVMVLKFFRGVNGEVSQGVRGGESRNISVRTRPAHIPIYTLRRQKSHVSCAHRKTPWIPR